MTKQTFVIDRIEDGIAVLECQATGEFIEIPKTAMPKGARDGHLLSKTDDGFVIDHAATQALREDMKRRLEKILGRKVK